MGKISSKIKILFGGENRLISVTYLNPQPPNVADNISFVYDGVNRRIGITEKHGSTVLMDKRFVWCEEKLCQERDGAGSSVTKQFFDQGERVGVTNYFFTFDHLGSVREMVDGSGVVQSRYDYDPWGRQTKLTENVVSDFGYTGFYMNHSSGMDLTWFRAYDSEKGTWLSRDPLGERTGPSLYAYGQNNTINYVDPLGLYCQFILGGNQTNRLPGIKKSRYIGLLVCTDSYIESCGKFKEGKDSVYEVYIYKGLIIIFDPKNGMTYLSAPDFTPLGPIDLGNAGACNKNPVYKPEFHSWF